MSATAVRHSSASLRTLACRASAFARACTSHLLAAFLLSSLLLSIPAHSEVALPNGENNQGQTPNNPTYGATASAVSVGQCGC